MAASFFDTNVVLYLASASDAKADRAERIIAEGGTVSVQVLNEVANVARRKMGLSWDELHAFLSALRRLVTVTPLDVETHELGLTLCERYSLSLYDAMIAAAALRADCDTLWSEDMHHGLVIEDRLQILDPFSRAARK